MVFVPDPLKNKYKDNNVSQLPYSNLYQEQQLTSTINVSIRLAQDHNDQNNIKLVWEYYVLNSGYKWNIERYNADDDRWEVVKTFAIDPEKSQDTYTTEGARYAKPLSIASTSAK